MKPSHFYFKHWFEILGQAPEWDMPSLEGMIGVFFVVVELFFILFSFALLLNVTECLYSK